MRVPQAIARRAGSCFQIRQSRKRDIGERLPFLSFSPLPLLLLSLSQLPAWRCRSPHGTAHRRTRQSADHRSIFLQLSSPLLLSPPCSCAASRQPCSAHKAPRARDGRLRAPFVLMRGSVSFLSPPSCGSPSRSFNPGLLRCLHLAALAAKRARNGEGRNAGNHPFAQSIHPPPPHPSQDIGRRTNWSAGWSSPTPSNAIKAPGRQPLIFPKPPFALLPYLPLSVLQLAQIWLCSMMLLLRAVKGKQLINHHQMAQEFLLPFFSSLLPLPVFSTPPPLSVSGCSWRNGTAGASPFSPVGGWGSSNVCEVSR